MTALIVTIHVIVSIALILIVLLQTGKGADMGAVFGGAGSQALFGTTGAATFLGKMTTVAAVVFMITSLSLAYLSKSGGDSVVSDIKPTTQQTQPSIPALPDEEALPPAVTDTPAAMDTQSATQSATGSAPADIPVDTLPDDTTPAEAATDNAIPSEAESPAPQESPAPTAE